MHKDQTHIKRNCFSIGIISSNLQSGCYIARQVEVWFQNTHVQITHMFMLMLTPHRFIFEPRADWFGAEDDLFSYILIHMFCFTRVDKRPRTLLH
jgi:hypothetical protein